MQIYLPIAEMAVEADSIFLVSAFVGVLSGIFGIGGGFLTTPFLIFMGIPPTIAVGTQACQLVASSVAGSIVPRSRGKSRIIEASPSTDGRHVPRIVRRLAKISLER